MDKRSAIHHWSASAEGAHFLCAFGGVMIWWMAGLTALIQLHRDRADCENGFDELKNPWGWGGYTTQDRERCNLSARVVALIYNGLSWYVRLAHPKTRLEAITSRPLLLSGAARLTQHARASRLLLTLVHEAKDEIKAMILKTSVDRSFVLETPDEC